jgi:DNA-binding XRE family transcriptional regulator
LEQGLRQKDLAKKIGVDEMTIVNWETGKTKPIKSNLERLKLLIDFPEGLETNLPNGRR